MLKTVNLTGTVDNIEQTYVELGYSTSTSLSAVNLTGTTSVTKDGIRQTYADFNLPRMWDNILGIFLFADRDHLKRVYLQNSGDPIAVWKGPMLLGNEIRFTHESIPMSQLPYTTLTVRVVYQGGGAEHAKLFILWEILPYFTKRTYRLGDINLPVSLDGYLTIPENNSITGKKMYISYKNGGLARTRTEV